MAKSYNYDLNMFREFAAETMVYMERHKLIEVFNRALAEIMVEQPEDVENWLGLNIKRIAKMIYENCLEIANTPECSAKPDVKFFQLPRSFLYRVVFHGRPGSGRKTQAIAFAKHHSLVYIDVDTLIYQTLRNRDNLASRLKAAYVNQNIYEKAAVLVDVVARRLLQDDCLRKGWVIVNYPINLCTLKDMFENSKIPPNKFVYLLCEELLAMRRLKEKPSLGCPQDMVSYWDKQMCHFNKTKVEMDEYLRRRHEALFVDANRCFEPVRVDVFAKLQQRPYLMGFND